MTISPTQQLISKSTLISQGAEAKVYKAYLTDASSPTSPILLKYRFKKGYRHPTLDVGLTKARVAGEARALLKCLRSGVSVPGIRMVDATEGVLGIEWIDGESVRRLLGGGADGDDLPESDTTEDAELELEEETSRLHEYETTLEDVMALIGTQIAKMHKADVIHGDLTTSNMMLRKPSSLPFQTQLVLIDFGLSYHSSLVEDKAVDLYVLERAFSSTHPDSEGMFAMVLSAYERATASKKDWDAVRLRLEDVRARGRKRSMVG